MSDHQTNMVVVGIIVRDEKIFIARRAATKAVFPEKFEFVGGHIDIDEQPEDALRREIKEEVGAEVHIGEVVGAFTYYSEDVFKIEVAYLCYLPVGVEPKINPADHSESLWIGREEIEKFDKNDEEAKLLTKAFKMIGE